MVSFSDVGGALCLDFVNTGSQRRSGPFVEKLLSYEDLVWWAAQFEQLSPDEVARLKTHAAAQPREAEHVLERARDLREAIYRVFSAHAHQNPADASDLQMISAEYARATSHRILAPTSEGQIDFAWSDDGSLDRPLWSIAVSAANLAASDDAGRVKECATENCNWLFFDASKNRSRRWCEMKECGNRAKARRHYHRKKTSD